MPTASKPLVIEKHAAYDKPRMFFLSVCALVTAGLSFAMRSSIARDLQTTFLDPIDKLRSAEMIGAILGVAFLGFAFTIAIGSPLLDKIGMGRLLGLSGVCFIGGTLIVIFAGSLAQVEHSDGIRKSNHFAYLMTRPWPVGKDSTSQPRDAAASSIACI